MKYSLACGTQPVKKKNEGMKKIIGDRIREIRVLRNLTQQELARSLGIHRGYLSILESNRNEPSELLILSMCRVLGVGYNWLKFGSGEKYEGVFPGRSNAVLAVMEEIHRRLKTDRKISLYELFKLLDVDFKDPGGSLNLPEEFFPALYMLIRIFNERDPGQIEAISSLLRAFMPNTKKYLWPQEDIDKVREYRRILVDQDSKTADFKREGLEIVLSPEVKKNIKK